MLANMFGFHIVIVFKIILEYLFYNESFKKTTISLKLIRINEIMNEKFKSKFESLKTLCLCTSLKLILFVPSTHTFVIHKKQKKI